MEGRRGAVFQVGSKPRLEVGQGGDRHELLKMFIPLCDCSWIQQHSSVAVLLRLIIRSGIVLGKNNIRLLLFCFSLIIQSGIVLETSTFSF